MPTGFRGQPARSYLTAVENALTAAINVHTENVFSRSGGGPAPPQLPWRGPHRSPHAPSTANSGGHSTGIRSSNNIVARQSDYDSLFRAVHQLDDDTFTRLRNTAIRLEQVCADSYNLPQATPKLLGVLHRSKRYSPRFRSLTQSKGQVARNFISNISNIS